MADPMMKYMAAGLTAALLIGACGQNAPAPQVQKSALTAQASQADRAEVRPSASLGMVRLDAPGLELTPEQAEGKARERATAWQADAQLRFVGWGVLKWELLSAVNHVFYSPSARQVLVVRTVLRDKWQSADAFDHVVVTKPAEVLQALTTDYNVDGSRALKLSRKYFAPWNKRPISLVTLTHPPKLKFAFWGVVADATVVLVHANTGQSLSPRGFDPFPKEWTK